MFSSQLPLRSKESVTGGLRQEQLAIAKMSSATLTFRNWSSFLRNDAKRIRFSCSRCWTPKRGSPRPPAGFEWGKSGLAHCWFDIWPIAYSSSGTPATMQWYFCFSWEPHWFYPSDGCECWSCKSKVPNVSSKLFWLLGPIVAQIATPKAAVQHLQSCCRCISSSVMNRLGQRKLFSTHDAA